MDLMKARNELAAQVHTAEEKAAKLEAQGTEVENNLNAILSEMERLEPKRLHLRSAWYYVCCRALLLGLGLSVRRLLSITLCEATCCKSALLEAAFQVSPKLCHPPCSAAWPQPVRHGFVPNLLCDLRCC